MTGPVIPSRTGSTTGPVLVAVAHGSTDPAAARAHQGLLARLRSAAPGVEVRLGYLDHVEPSVSQVLRECAESGWDAVVVPLLLGPASHARGDIPAAVRAARRDSVRCTYARVLGPHPLLLRAVTRRLAEAGVPDTAAVVLAAAGSADPEANAEVARVARLLWEWRRGVAPVEPAFASATRPSVPEVVDRLRRLGHDRPAVASYFLAPGRLPDRVAAGAGGATVTEPLVDSAEVAEVVLARYAESVARSAPMSCDLCTYRAPWPGRERRVGAAQRVHPHPADPPSGHQDGAPQGDSSR